ncbi:conserved hypothetical protein [Perkinsus marinus ATCC 50983]|uniref:Molybdate-anion transporter n=1 Tax=Perkinsus marinus (strain ATCC 50983 / TXsc) TaxID=423536 RepID=C5KEB6_PERM5|nr:conserved hypothetical protein [Perkinsus marinus ATCC 50983]EER17174.1 conserved hypothetical protein [Perkinsus marinus ATCC 50983]|eukprot:XP_002785378.1 conserved hypothetical protein [Perkinsus marinus ATCC 50983]
MSIPQTSLDEGEVVTALDSESLRFVFAVMLACTGIMYWTARRRTNQRSQEETPLEKYVYALYESYGFDRHQNASLFVCGFASSMLLGTFIGSLADRFGRKKFCMLYCCLYILSCVTKHIPLYPVLMLGRLLGGMATSLLFSVFETWFICEATTTGQAHLISNTLGIAVGLNSVTAIVAGEETHMSMYQVYCRYCSPFDLAIVSLLVTALCIHTTWRENYGANDSNSAKNENVLHSLQSHHSIIPLGCIQALYESAMYIFVFMWTPALEQANGGVAISLGLVFACFMTACTVGSQMFRLVCDSTYCIELYCRYVSTTTDQRLSSAAILRLVCLAGLVSQGTVFPNSPWTVLIAFLVFETSVGAYYPSMGTLKAEIVPEAYRATIYNLFRVPLNLLVIAALLAKLEVAEAFGVASLLLALALMLSIRIREPSRTGCSDLIVVFDFSLD